MKLIKKIIVTVFVCGLSFNITPMDQSIPKEKIESLFTQVKTTLTHTPTEIKELSSKELLEIRNTQKQTLLHAAAEAGNLLVAEHLLGASKEFLSIVDHAQKTPLDIAINKTSASIAEFLANKTPKNTIIQNPIANSTYNPLLYTLMNTSASNHVLVKVVHIFIVDKKIDVNEQTSTKENALMMASRLPGGAEEIVKELLDNNSEKDHQNSQGNTALHIAAQQGHLLIVQTLLAHGCSPLIKNSQGKIPLDVANSSEIHDKLLTAQRQWRFKQIVSIVFPSVCVLAGLYLTGKLRFYTIPFILTMWGKK